MLSRDISTTWTNTESWCYCKIWKLKFIADNANELFQSRNIMIRNDEPFIIDFQSARIGPLQYDLASLLIDPYVNLSDEIQKTLFEIYL